MKRLQASLKRGGCYLDFAIIAVVWIILVRVFLPFEAIPYVFERFLFFKGEWWEPLLAAWPLFGVGFLFNFFLMATTVNAPEIQKNAPQIPLWGLSTSLMAGIMEEITFRWVLLYGFMGLFWVINQLLIQVVGRGLLEEAFSPVATLVNPFLVGGVEEVLNHPGAWTIGLAILAANWKFQTGHLYQGLVGFVFSWFAGLIFFQTVFKYGLFAAMLTHFSLDLMVAFMLLIDVLIELILGLEQPNKKLHQWYVSQPFNPSGQTG
jgi:hypothetical protein